MTSFSFYLLVAALVALVGAIVLLRITGNRLVAILLSLVALSLAVASPLAGKAPSLEEPIDLERCVGSVLAEEALRLSPGTDPVVVLVLPPLRGEGLDLSHQRLRGLEKVFARNGKPFVLAGPDPFGRGSTDSRFQLLPEGNGLSMAANQLAASNQAVGIVSLLDILPESAGTDAESPWWIGAFAGRPGTQPRIGPKRPQLKALLLLKSIHLEVEEPAGPPPSDCETRVLTDYEWMRP